MLAWPRGARSAHHPEGMLPLDFVLGSGSPTSLPVPHPNALQGPVSYCAAFLWYWLPPASGPLNVSSLCLEVVPLPGPLSEPQDTVLAGPPWGTCLPAATWARRSCCGQEAELCSLRTPCPSTLGNLGRTSGPQPLDLGGRKRSSLGSCEAPLQAPGRCQLGCGLHSGVGPARGPGLQPQGRLSIASHHQRRHEPAGVRELLPGCCQVSPHPRPTEQSPGRGAGWASPSTAPPLQWQPGPV